jgi:branched-chain amino acid transport system permease protein
MDRTQASLTGAFLAAIAAAYLGMPIWILNALQHALCTALPALMLLLLWRSGLVSFGHALYFGGGAYAAVAVNQVLKSSDVALVLACAALATGWVGYLLGFIVRRFRGIFFAMLNLALSMVLYGAIVKSNALGSTDGFSVMAPTLFGVRLSEPEANVRLLFFITAAITLGVTLALHRYIGSVMGAVTTAVRDNEVRLDYLGFSPNAAVHWNYTISAAVSGIGGALLALTVGQVDPDSMVSWTTSGELVFIMVLGGAGSVAAPILGSLVFEVLRLYAFELAPSASRLVVGGTLLVLILFRPGGLWSILAAPGRAKTRKIDSTLTELSS